MNTTVKNAWGVEINYEAAVNFMDYEIREILNEEIAPCTEQEFFDAYCMEHEEVFGEEWVLANENPIF